MYWLVKQIVKIQLFFYFKRIVVSGRENLRSEGPLIVVANHPNTLMDPLIIGTLMKQRMGFMAKSGLFINKLVSMFLRYFHVIPVYRKADAKPNEKPDNRKTFAKCHEYLNNKGTLLIFPEGTSLHELTLREIKTGTARIALSLPPNADVEKLQILPISLDYSDAIYFRSMVSVTVGKPFSLDEYEAIYAQSESEGVKALTERISSELSNPIPITADKEQEAFLIQAHKFYTTFEAPEAGLHMDPKTSLEYRKGISEELNALAERDHALYADTQQKVGQFFNLLKIEKLTPGLFTQAFLKKNKAWICLSYFFKLLLLLPIYLFGLVSNYIPYILPSKVFEVLKVDIEYKTSIQVFIGLFTFPLYYWILVTQIGKHFPLDTWQTPALILLFAFSGYVAMFYWTELKRFIRVLRFYFLVDKSVKGDVLKLKDEIFTNLNRINRSTGHH